MTISIRDRDASPQDTSPLFTHIPVELRLMIYNLFFVGCRATVWLDAKYGPPPVSRRIRRRNRLVRLPKDGQCCYSHSRGGFSLLICCRLVYIEAFQSYWENTTLSVSKRLFHYRSECELERVCLLLPTEIKANLRHLQNTKLPRLGGKDSPTDHGTNTVSALLRHFPKLVTCAFVGRPPLTRMMGKAYFPGLPQKENFARSYAGYGPFQLMEKESPAAYLERGFGIQKSCPIIFLSRYETQGRRDLDHSCEPRVSPIPIYLCDPGGMCCTDRFGKRGSISTLISPRAWFSRFP